MSEITPKTILDSIEIIREVKSLFFQPNPYLPLYSALGGAFIGAVATIIPSYVIHRLKERRDKRSTTLQIYTEVKVTLEFVERRGYINNLSQIVNRLTEDESQRVTYEVQVGDEFLPIIKCCLDRLGILDTDIQVKVIEFYQLIGGLIQDVKPGGLLNSQPASLNAFNEALLIALQAREIGHNLVQIVEQRYRIKI